MGSFSQIAEDSYILSEAADAKSVCIIGCPHCANQSLDYAKGMSVIGKSGFGGLSYKPYAITQEANRLKELFAQKGVAATVKIFKKIESPPCWLHQKERNEVAKACEKADAAVALCCNSGRRGLKTALPASFKVISGMSTVGSISAHLTLENGNDVMDKSKTEVVYLKNFKSAT
jgi:hypothetical protein